MTCILALDQSTSATKALLFSTDGRVLDREALEHRQLYPQPGWVEHDAEEIWANTLSVLRSVFARNPEAASAACLSITNQRETVVIFDRLSGRPLRPALVWQDRRGEALCAGHERAGKGPLLHERTGLRFDAYFSASKLQWVMRNEPEVANALKDGSALIGTIDAYLIHRLTEGRVFATDTTNASRTLLYDIRRMAWDEELCALWEVPLKALPRVLDSTAKFGETTLGGFLKSPLTLCGVIGDSQASLFAQRCFEPGSAKVTFGTGSSLLMNIGGEPRLSGNGVLTALAWSHAGVPTYAFEGIIISSAATLAWLRDQLGLISSYDELEPLATSVESSGGVYLVPAFSGLGLPHWAPSARAAIVGLSSHSDRRHILRAGLESIAFQVADALEAMGREAGVSIGTIHADGGATRSPFLMQLAADLTRSRILIPDAPDCSPLGAALAGLLGIGHFRDLAHIAESPLPGCAFSPQLPPAEAVSLRAGWQSAVRQVLAV